MAGKRNWAGIVGWGLAVLFSPLLLMSGIMKLMSTPQVHEGFAHLGWPDSLIVPLGILELACLVIYLLPPTAVLGAILLTGYMGGAIATHVRLGEPVVTHIALGVAIWLGLFLRDKRLRELLPVRGKEFHYEREIVIDRPVEQVFAHLKLLKNFRAWNPFLRHDPDCKVEYEGVDGEPGFVSKWSGNKNVGRGEQEIAKVKANDLIAFELRFIEPFAAVNQAYFQTASVDAGRTRVKWGMRGRTLFPMTVFGLFMSMEKMIGGEFENGLKRLKEILER